MESYPEGQDETHAEESEFNMASVPEQAPHY